MFPMIRSSKHAYTLLHFYAAGDVPKWVALVWDCLSLLWGYRNSLWKKVCKKKLSSHNSEKKSENAKLEIAYMSVFKPHLFKNQLLGRIYKGENEAKTLRLWTPPTQDCTSSTCLHKARLCLRNHWKTKKRPLCSSPQKSVKSQSINFCDPSPTPPTSCTVLCTCWSMMRCRNPEKCNPTFFKGSRNTRKENTFKKNPTDVSGPNNQNRMVGRWG